MSEGKADAVGKADHVALVITRFGDGGVERMLVNTANGLAELGVEVSLLAGQSQGPYLDLLSPRVRCCVLDQQRPQQCLAAFLRATRPGAAISGKLADDRILIGARDAAGVATRVYFRVGNPLGYRAGARNGNPLARWWKLRNLRRLYHRADGYIAVSRGIADDLVRYLDVPRERIHVLPNPVVTDALLNQPRTRPGHPWFAPGEPPVILGAGGLRQQKDFSTLIRAFALLRARRRCRLVILGEGRQRRRLERLVRNLGVEEDVDLPGWKPDLHAYMAHAAVFALSSRWEGFGNVLVEAMALGTPVVATDCPTGPREILQGGKRGALVPVGESDALADALDGALEVPPSTDLSRQAAEPYRVVRSAMAYLDALGLKPTESAVFCPHGAKGV